MSISEWIQFLIPIFVPILIPLITGGGVFYLVWKEKRDREDREKKEREDAIKARADATQTLTLAGATLAKESGNVWQGIIRQLQEDAKEFRSQIEALEKEVTALKKEVAIKDNRLVRLVQAVRNNLSERNKAIDENCTAQRHAELDEKLLNEMNTIMAE